MFILALISTLLVIYTFILFARIVLDMVRVFAWQDAPAPSGIIRIYGILHDLTEPVLRPIRRIIPPLRVGVLAVDLSPVIVFILIRLLQWGISEIRF
jgi:YggT family protein